VATETRSTLDRLAPAARRFVERRPLHPFVDGAFTASDGSVADDVYPATGEVIARVRAAEESEVDLAVGVARRAFGEWSLTPPATRSLVLFRLAELLEAEGEALAQLETLDTGKPIREARLDVARGIDGLRFYAGAARQIRGETIDVERGLHVWTLRRPIGVVAAIVPWNVPFVLTVCKAAPALAAGNAVVVKPSEATPLSALWLAETAVQAGLPAGALNVVTGPGRRVGAALAGHVDIDKVTFTGSNATGAAIAAAVSDPLKGVALELGGKSPQLIFADADLEAAAAAAAAGVFYGQGEICTAGSRILIERTVYAEVIERVVEHARRLKVGDPLDDATELGALIGEDHLGSVLACVERGRADGAELLAGGVRVDDGSCAGGSFMAATILANERPDAFIEQHEIFGPVAVAGAFDDEASALARANATPFGLSAGIWTSDTARARRLAEGIQAGVVWVNTYNRFDAAAPFGGAKASGNAREWSHVALDFFTELKTVWEQA
jgi:aldehyde dehydrogenase (NAD+)